MVSSSTRDNRLSKSSPPKAACDRCRGQKLRCIWDPKGPQCQRCARANTVCTVPLPRPMGRPPRHHRSASSHIRGQSEGLYAWSEESPPAPGSGDEASDMPMTSANVLSHPLDFLPWVPEPDGLNLFAPGSAITAALTTTPDMPNLSATALVSRPFSPRYEAFAQMLNNNPSEGELGDRDPTHDRDLDDYDDHMNFASAQNEDNQIKLLTQLCELNIALFQHPLHHNNDKAAAGSRPATTPENNAQQPAPADAQSAHSPPRSTDVSLADLGTGKLFEMTCRLKDIVTRIRTPEQSAAQGPERYDRPTALMALSCYTRLDILYSRALEILIRTRNSCGQGLDGTHPQMPELIIDGFSMGRCLDLQLNFLIHLHEQAGERIRACIRSAEGTTRVARERRDPNRPVQPGPSQYS